MMVAVKVVPDDQDIQVAASGELDMSKAHQTISAYDVNRQSRLPRSLRQVSVTLR